MTGREGGREGGVTGREGEVIMRWPGLLLLLATAQAAASIANRKQNKESLFHSPTVQTSFLVRLGPK